VKFLEKYQNFKNNAFPLKKTTMDQNQGEGWQGRIKNTKRIESTTEEEIKRRTIWINRNTDRSMRRTHNETWKMWIIYIKFYSTKQSLIIYRFKQIPKLFEFANDTRQMPSL
jgi:hypothetical protein